MVRQSRLKVARKVVCKFLVYIIEVPVVVTAKSIAISQRQLLLLPQCTVMGPSRSSIVMLLWDPAVDPANR